MKTAASNRMDIFVRRDLNMRKGKMSAQVAHAACAQLLNAMDDLVLYRVLSAHHHRSLLALLEQEAVTIDLVADEAALRAALKSPERSSIIIDRGLTEFGGVPTLTTAAQGVFEPSDLKAVPMSGQDLIARQWFVFSKEQPLPKEVAAKMAALGCLKMMASLLIPMRDSGGAMMLDLEDPALFGWLTAGFGKIGMGIKTDAALSTLHDDLQAAGVHTVEQQMGANKLLVIGPQFPETIASITGRESALYTSGMLTLL